MQVEEIVKLLCDVSAVAELDKFKMESMVRIADGLSSRQPCMFFDLMHEYVLFIEL
jgi:hypothetical protein